MTRADPDRYCAQHHQPRSQCRPGDRHVRTMRFRDDDWEAAEATTREAWAALKVKTDIAKMTTLAVTAMSGYIRCYRCPEDAPPVPVQMGDLTGMTLREALFAAEKQVAAQHPRHQPVIVGSGTLRAAPVPFRAPAVTPVSEQQEPVSEEFAVFAAEFREHLLDGLPEDEKQLWRDLR
jgi:hypothetical protein